MKPAARTLEERLEVVNAHGGELMDWLRDTYDSPLTALMGVIVAKYALTATIVSHAEDPVLEAQMISKLEHLMLGRMRSASELEEPAGGRFAAMNRDDDGKRDAEEGNALVALQELLGKLEGAKLIRLDVPPPLQDRRRLDELVGDALAHLTKELPKKYHPKAYAIVLRLERLIRAELELASWESVEAGNRVRVGGGARWAYQAGVLQSALLAFVGRRS